MAHIVHVEFGDGQVLKCFRSPELSIHEGALCIVEIERVTEAGRAVKLEETTDDLTAPKRAPRVLRCATLQDRAKDDENTLMTKIAMDSCRESVKKHNLDMRLVSVRYSFDRSVLKVLFVAEHRVDFREMIKDLASQLHARIEMRQIGVRDEAGIIGGFGPCGRFLCCCSWLSHFESINVKMAKTQRLSLNPAAISGMCGRLKCCLRYEFDEYKRLGRQLPRQGTCVKCPDGTGCVTDCSILSQRVKVRLDDDRLMEYDASQVSKNWSNDNRNRRTRDESSHTERPQSEPSGET